MSESGICFHHLHRDGDDGDVYIGDGVVGVGVDLSQVEVINFSISCAVTHGVINI